MSHRAIKHVSAACWLALGLSLGGCGGGNTQDLQRFVEEARARQPTKIEPLPEFKPYETFLYQASDLRNPFVASEPGQAEQLLAGNSSSKLHPDANRPREALESFPLDTLRMVGTLSQHGESWGLVLASDGTIHRIQPGNYLGQNHGKVRNISEFEIGVLEIVPDGLGGWMERPASLALSE
ncbi:MAG: pilus assembly protein PilP [Gammaproteobacteria bacterium]